MSGAFGWARNDTRDLGGTRFDPGYDDDSVRLRYQGGSARARSYAPPPPPPRVDMSQVRSQVHGATPNGLHALKSTAANVLIVAMDATGSMGGNPEEIFKRLPLMYQEAVTLLGTEDVEILFIVFGDARTDRAPVQVARFGRGPELDPMLASFDLGGCYGGGQGSETPELIAYYLLKQVDTSTARNVYTWFITDEAGCEQVDPGQVERELGLSLDRTFSQASTVFDALRTRMNIMCILFDTGSYNDMPRLRARFRPYWEEKLGAECVLSLDDPRRIVDVMLGSIAVMTGQLDLFTKKLKSRQMPTRHGSVNVQTVLGSISILGGRGTPSAPHVLPAQGTTPLLAPPGTKSLLDDD